MQLLLVRHGESVGNLTNMLQGPDDPLTDRGRRQAREIAAYLATRGAARALYTSPLVRAHETAAITGAAIGLAPIPREARAEINIGEAAGLTPQEWAARVPDEAARFREDGVDCAFPGGETGRQLGARPAAEIDAIISAHRLEPGAVALVSHGGALAWIIDHLLREPRDTWPRHRLDNCSLTEVTIDPSDSQAVTFVCLNEVGHLSPEPEGDVATGRVPS